MEEVVRTRVGYAGGGTDNPTYRMLGDHTESIQIDYDPIQISYSELLSIFWNSHSPEYQMNNRQYMSIIFYHNQEQLELAQKSKEEEEQRRGANLYTEIIPLTKFYLAEAYHQKYYLQIVKPLTEHFRKIYPDIKDFINSTAVARVNGYIKGYGTLKMLQQDIDRLGLPQMYIKRLTEIVEGYGR